MSDILNQFEEIKTLISSEIKSNKSLAYSTLLHLQQASDGESSSIIALAEFSRDSIRLIVSDTRDEDEEVAAQALKCLGFIIYHPSTIAAIPVTEANLIIESLAELIITTKIKSVRNLGVWCISIQQLDTDILYEHFDSLLLAIVHGIDNPNGSLSTTFEAIQAVMKMATKLSDKMRESSNIWAPPIYRRLLSSDKRERDMSERCLFKIRSTILPPPLILSKALVKDMKESLLIEMDKLLDVGMKVQTVEAWGWFIRLLGSHSTKNKNLVNKMLKVPERTFSDHDPQVLIASQVAWEGLIDALVHLPTPLSDINAAKEANNPTAQTISGNNFDIEAYGLLKGIKLIMVPLVGVMMGKCNISVRLNCLNTWHYLLYKLDTFVSSLSMIKVVLEPMFEAIFRLVPDDENIRLWNMCLSLLDDFLLVKCSKVDIGFTGQLSCQPVGPVSNIEHSGVLKRSWNWKQHHIKWLPWNLNQLDFLLNMVSVMTTSASVETISNESRTLAYDACLKVFISVLKGVKLELKEPSVNYDDVMVGLRKILRFLKHLFEDVTAEDCVQCHLLYAMLHFVEAVTKELEPAILGSHLYKVALDLVEIGTVQTANYIGYAQVLDIHYNISFLDMVPPMVYLVVLYSLIAVRSTSTLSTTNFIQHDLHKYFILVFSSIESPENLVPAILVLYMNIRSSSLKIWIAVGKGLMESGNMGNYFLSRTKLDTAGYKDICHLLAYPFVVCSQKESCHPPLEKLDLESVVQVWKSLYGFVSTLQSGYPLRTYFIADLASLLNGFLDGHGKLNCESEPCSSCEDFGVNFLSIYFEVVISILEGLQVSESSDRAMEEDDMFCKETSCIRSSLILVTRYMELLRIKLESDQSSGLFMASGLFSALSQFVSSLRVKQDIILFIEVVSCPLLLWLTKMELWDESISAQLQILWAEIIKCLQRGCCSSLTSDLANYMKLLAPLLEKTLDHSNSHISLPTITFWNSSFGEHFELNYPQNLLPILHKLSRNNKIKLQKRCSWAVEKCDAKQDNINHNNPPYSYKVTAMSVRSSKRIELITRSVDELEHKVLSNSNLKRKRTELTEHQKEVRRAQQGKAWDCGGHGPGIRTYTSLDFSQVVNDSQESQDTQNTQNPDEIIRTDELLLH